MRMPFLSCGLPFPVRNPALSLSRFVCRFHSKKSIASTLLCLPFPVQIPAFPLPPLPGVSSAEFRVDPAPSFSFWIHREEKTRNKDLEKASPRIAFSLLPPRQRGAHGCLRFLRDRQRSPSRQLRADA
jgi:hypothetical protein